MRFTCEHCGKRYVVKDELLPGRTYRSKCKVCGHVIVVKGGADEATEDDLQVIPTSDTPSSPAVPAPARATPISAPPAPSRSVFSAPSRPTIPLSTPGTTPPSRPSIPVPPVSMAPVSATPRPAIPPPIVTSPPAAAPAVATLASSIASSMPPAPEAARSAPRDDAGYIDLFDGKGFDDMAPLEPAPELRAEASAVRESTVIPPAPARPLTTIHVPNIAPLPEIIPPASTALTRAAPPSSAPAQSRRLTPLIIGAVAVVVIVALGAVAALRPWRSEGLAKAPPSLPSDKPTPTASEPARTATAEPTGTAAQPAKAEPAPEPAEPAKPEPAKAAEPAKPEPAKAAEPEVKVAKVVEGLPAAAIRRVLRSGKRSFERCLANPSRGLARPLEPRRIALHLSVEPTGAVSALAIDDAAVAKAPVGQCLKTAGLGMVFPRFQGPPILVEAPVEIPASPGTNAPPPAPPEKEKATAPSGPPMVAVEFSGVSRTVAGGEIGDSRYSQKPDDTSITDRQYNEGVLTYSGQVGLGNGSAYGGMGFYVNVRPGGQPIDASRFRTVTLRLSSPTTRALRVRLQGPEQSVASAGCYPMAILGVGPTMKTYKLVLEDFAPDLGCGARGRYPEDTLPQLVGFEVVDIAVQNKPTSFSVGSITLNP